MKEETRCRGVGKSTEREVAGQVIYAKNGTHTVAHSTLQEPLQHLRHSRLSQNY